MATVTNSTAGFFRRSTDQMASLRAGAERLQDQISTGERITTGSDDPLAATRLRGLSRAGRLAAIDQASTARASEDLRAADSAIETMADQLSRARALAVQAASETISPAQRALIGVELAQLHEGLIAAANTRGSDGRSLFSGLVDGPAYTTDAAGNAVYAGGALVGELDLGEGLSVPRGVTGPDLLGFTHNGAATDVLAFIKGLADALQGAVPDPAAAARDALGGFDGGLESLTRAQTQIGVRVAWIETVQDRQIQSDEARTQQTEEVGGVDFASTIAELQQMLVVLEASQAGFARLSQLSLFNAI